MPDGLLFISTRTENIPSQILDNSQEKMEALSLMYHNRTLKQIFTVKVFTSCNSPLLQLQ